MKYKSMHYIFYFYIRIIQFTNAKILSKCCPLAMASMNECTNASLFTLICCVVKEYLYYAKNVLITIMLFCVYNNFELNISFVFMCVTLGRRHVYFYM